MTTTKLGTIACSLSLVLALIPASEVSAQVSQKPTHTPWKMHNGLDEQKTGEKFFYDFKYAKSVNASTPIEELFVGAKIPPPDDPGWKDAPDGKTINFSPGSKLPGCNTLADYTYFDTSVTIPSGVNVKTFTIHFEGMDDASRITVFNDKHPEGQVVKDSYVKVRTSGPKDLLADKELQLAESNRVVITQVDTCRPGNNLKKAEVVLDGAVVATADEKGKPKTKPNTVGDVHISTPDGLRYDFQAAGEFLLTQSTSGDVVLQARQEKWGKKPQVSINTATALWVAGDKLEFYLKPERSFYVNDEKTDLPTSTLQLPKGGRIEINQSNESKQDFNIYWPDGNTGARVVLYADSHIDIGIARLSGSLTYEGLLGNLDGDPQNDLQFRGSDKQLESPDKFEDLMSFGDSWRISAKESLFNDAALTDQAVAAEGQLTLSDLDPAARADAKKTCQNADISDPLALDNCTYDVAATGDIIFVESAKTFQDSIEAAEPPAFPAEALAKLATDIAACRAGLQLLGDNPYKHPADPKTATGGARAWTDVWNEFAKNHLPGCDGVGAFLKEHAGKPALAEVEAITNAKDSKGWAGYIKTIGVIGVNIPKYCPKDNKIQFNCERAPNDLAGFSSSAVQVMDLLDKLQ